MSSRSRYSRAAIEVSSPGNMMLRSLTFIAEQGNDGNRYVKTVEAVQVKWSGKKCNVQVIFDGH